MTLSPRITGTLYEAGSSAGVRAAFFCKGGGLYLETGGGEPERLEGESLTVSDKIAGVPRRLTLPDGRTFVTPQTPELTTFLKGGPDTQDTGRLVAWLERPGARRLVFLVVVFVAVLAGLRWAVPMGADLAAYLIPPSVERALGAASLEGLDQDQDWSPLGETQLPQDQQKAIQARFDTLVNAAGLPPDTRLEFRASPVFGPNAFAFPGGPVLLTDELVIFAKGDLDALTGILAHEVTHVSEHHGTRRLMRLAGVSLTMAVVIGDVGSLMDQVSVLSALVVDRSYSRAFEREADAGAVRLMNATGTDLAPLRALMDRFQETHGTGGGWLSTHPDFDERRAILGGDPREPLQ